MLKTFKIALRVNIPRVITSFTHPMGDSMAENLPLTYLDKNNSENEKYVFISYCHRDSEWVYPILRELYSLGLNYWYDSRLDKGDLWDEVVEIRIRDEHCVGSIVFSSYEYMRSKACEQEMHAIYEMSQKRPFRYFAISDRLASPGDILARAYVRTKVDSSVITALRMCDDSSIMDFIRDNLFDQFPIERAEIVSKLFPSNKIWTNTDAEEDKALAFVSDQAFYDSIIRAFEKDGAVNNLDTLVGELGLKNDEADNVIVELGTYPVRDRYSGSCLINGNFVKPVPNEWYVVKGTGETIVLVSRYPIATNVQPRRADIATILERFWNNCLSDEERGIIKKEELRLMDVCEFYSYFRDGSLDPICKHNPLDKKDSSAAWIIVSENNGYSMISVMGKLVMTCPFGGGLAIRPVLKISLTAFKGLKRKGGE